MTERIGYIPSYVLSGEIGIKIAELKEMEKGWLYPTYLFKYLKNPAPLFLYDKIIVDEEAAENALDLFKWATKSKGIENRVMSDENITNKDVEVLNNLLDTDLFIKENIEEKLNHIDYERISESYNQDVNSQTFNEACKYLIAAYGSDYARPNPVSFEAMNINLTLILLEKLSAKPIDDILRTPLYQYKERNLLNEIQISQEIYESTRAFLYLPNESIVDVDAFLDYHKDNRIINFRNKINEIEHKNMTENNISLLIHRENEKLNELKPNRWNLVHTVSGSIIFSLSIQVPSTFTFATATIGLIDSLTNIIQEIQKYQKRKSFQWLQLIRGFLETQ